MTNEKKHRIKRLPKKRRYTPAFIAQLTKDLLEWSKNEKSFWLGDFAALNGMNHRRFPEIAETNEEFSQAYEFAKGVQETKLFKMGLSRKYNPAMAIFALKNVAGWRDTQDITSAGEKLESIEVKIVRTKEA